MPNKRIEDGRVPRRVGCDKRMRLTVEQREEIRQNVEGLSNHALAAKYGVSRRTIQFIRNPDAYRENLMRRAERGGWSRYYDKDLHRVYMQDHRAHKQELLDSGVLEGDAGR